MLFVLGLMSCAVLLTACAVGYMKPGMTEADFSRAHDACQQDAVRQYPPVMAPGFPDGFQTDSNTEKRNGAIASCMKAKGWMSSNEVHYWSK
jgi:hypothetical protein